MKVEDLRQLPAFMAAWPDCRDAIMEYLSRRCLSATAKASTETGPQTLALLIEDLERLDASPRPIIKPKGMKPLNSMSNPTEKK